MKDLMIGKVHTTPMGVERIKKNLELVSANSDSQYDTEQVIKYCKEQLGKAIVERKGKNWYARTDTEVYTINVYSHTIITAHKRRK